MAFPNAYISTDEPPRRSVLRAAMCVTAMAGVGYLGSVILVLSLLWGGYSPVAQVASDYGVGPMGPLMNSGFLLAGAGVVGLGGVILFSRRRRVERVGGALLLPSGVALVVNAFFQTDVEGAARTLHGTIHGLGGAAFFFTAPVGLLLVSYGLGRKRFSLTLLAFLAAVVLLAIDAPLGLNAAGLAERVVILAIFSSLILTARRVYSET